MFLLLLGLKTKKPKYRNDNVNICRQKNLINVKKCATFFLSNALEVTTCKILLDWIKFHVWSYFRYFAKCRVKDKI